MSWFFIALIAPFLWAIVNHTDKYLLSRYFKRGGVGALMIFSTLSSLIVLLVAFFMSPDLFHISFSGVSTLIVAGLFYSVGVFFYLVALQDEEATIVVPFFQLIPVFGYFLGYLFLGEGLTGIQIAAGALIIVGAVLLSLDLGKEAEPRFKMKTAIMMAAASFVLALYGVLFKVVALDAGFWVSTFWEHIGLLIFGLFLFAFVASYRKEFVSLFKNNSVGIFSLNMGSEIFSLTGNIVTAYATLLAPVALVFLVSSYQPFFVLILGVCLTLLFPKVVHESLAPRVLIQKIIAIAIIFVGSFFLG